MKRIKTFENSNFDDIIIKILKSGLDITIKTVHKRIDGDWLLRYIWEVNDKKECIWEGFETPEKCIKNLYEVILKETTDKYNL